MAFRHTFTAVRSDDPHWPSVVNTLRQTDSSVGGGASIDRLIGTLDKDTDWTPQQITQTQTVINNAPADSPALQAQFIIDALPILEKAILLTAFDELNNLREWIAGFKAATSAATSLADLKARVALLPDMPDRTVSQAIAAVRAKAGTL